MARTYDPKLREFASEAELKWLDAIDEHGGPTKAARELGVHHSALTRGIDRLEAQAAKMGWSPAHDMTHIVPDGYLVKGISTYYNKDGVPAGQWVKSSIDHEKQEALMRAACAAMAESLPRVNAAPGPERTDQALCNLAVFSDYHIGQMAWGVESGADWDLKIAEQLLLASFLHMIEAAPRAKTCVLCLQGDTLDVDSILPVTPAHKNVLDVDGRYSKILAVAIRVIRRLIDHALAKHESVHLIICQGNHDESTSILMRHMFGALYENEPRLTVNDSELPFYVYQHGETMLAFHHGHKCSNEQLPLLFAAQYPKIWGATTKRYAHAGHRHHVDEKEFSGMTVIQHPTLAARNAHAARGGWISERAASIITYHEKYGQVARNTVCPEMFETV
ncbi:MULTISPECIES: LysR family transcriptional regulator [unclassified Burkholderia]|uniref:helix-turn-helix domain-containing protein n=1 Tax=unclassified Burkholderia TaxID=2613784 RepID=UPI000F577D51|nr:MULTISPECIES: LysR family transcriptional regulator [unclassified Burkholderia]RQR87711.1 LysR family transcriptional regulator [Burkholderia sp. Bp9011]RQR97055.1 LysR family transcriptional regulator [Burkholderia sp. Bp9010]